MCNELSRPAQYNHRGGDTMFTEDEKKLIVQALEFLYWGDDLNTTTELEQSRISALITKIKEKTTNETE
jgi:hypothetical protein